MAHPVDTLIFTFSALVIFGFCVLAVIGSVVLLCATVRSIIWVVRAIGIKKKSVELTPTEEVLLIDPLEEKFAQLEREERVRQGLEQIAVLSGSSVLCVNGTVLKRDA